MANGRGKLFAPALAFIGSANAFWRMNCNVIQTGRVDPIVNPGAVAAHCHTIVGASSMAPHLPKMLPLTSPRHWGELDL